jgi:hypothetical protein
MSEEKEPMAPWGSFFWARSDALKKLFAADWNYSDFPEDMSLPDGTILHAIERIYPYLVQQEGYFAATVMADTFARVETTNLYHFIRGYNTVLIEYNIFGSYEFMRQQIKKEMQLSIDRLRSVQFFETSVLEKTSEAQHWQGIAAERLTEVRLLQSVADERLRDVLSKQKQIDDMDRKISDLQGEIMRLIPLTSLKRQVKMRLARIAKSVWPFKKAKTIHK